MYALMLLATMAPGQLPDWCSWGWYGGSYAHGYGLFRPVEGEAGGVVLPPNWPGNPTLPGDRNHWFGYLMQLDGYRHGPDLLRVWKRATPEARFRLLAKLPALAAEAALYREQVERERAMERFKIENRPMTAEEIQSFETIYLKLKGAARSPREAWLYSNNRERRIYLKELIRELEEKELQREDEKDDADEAEIQKERTKKEKDKRRRRRTRTRTRRTRTRTRTEKKDKDKTRRTRRTRTEKDKKDN